jgi:hypothetical protein
MNYPKIERIHPRCIIYDYGNNIKKFSYSDGDIYWIKEITYPNGTKDQIKHNLNGPAINCADGHQSWWINGQKINCSSQIEFERILKLKPFL